MKVQNIKKITKRKQKGGNIGNGYIACIYG